MKFLKIIQDPVSVINAKKKSMNETLFVLFVSSVIFALSFVLTFKQYDMNSIVISFLSVFILVVIGELVVSYVINVFMKTALSRGSYYEALTSNTYSLPSLSLGLLVFSLLSYIPSFGMLLGALVMMVATALSLSTFIRALKELYKSDLITVYVCMVLVLMSLFLTLYFVIFSSALAYAPLSMVGV